MAKAVSIERMSDRCKRICGNVDKPCYVDNKNHIGCLTDSIINRTSAICMMLNYSINETDKEALDNNIKDSLAIANELSNWIKYIQLIGNLQKLLPLVLNSDAGEKRREIRYPLPDAFTEDFKTQIKMNCAPMPSALVNYSQSGVQLMTPEPIGPGSVIECRLSAGTSNNGSKGVPFKAKIVYSVESMDGFVTGAKLEEVFGSPVFNFFNSVHGLIIETQNMP